MKTYPTFEWLFVDLDGTIVTDDFLLPQKTIDIFQELKKRIRVSVATGRAYRSAELFMQQLKTEEISIFQNGAMICNPKTGHKETVYLIPPDSACRIIDWSFAQKMSFKMHCADETILKSNTETWEDEITIDAETTGPEEMKQYVGDGVIKFIFYSNPTQIQRFSNGLTPLVSDKLSRIRMFKSNDKFWEITHEEASKGAALLSLISRHNIAADRVVAVGDHDNDIEMLSVVGLPVTVFGGSENVKPIAKLMIPGPEESGIEKLFDIIR